MSDEFYIGWEAKTAPGISKTVRKAVVLVLGLALLVPMVLAVSQRLIGASVFEWGNQKTFSGVLQLAPYPHLLVMRPGDSSGHPQFSTYHLVAPWKFGLDPAVLTPFAGKSVSLKGTLIYRDSQTMIEVVPDSITATNNGVVNSALPVVALGKQTLVGEIVDSKCSWV